MSNIKPCPFCGSKDLTIGGTSNVKYSKFCICETCGCTLDNKPYEQKAIEAWNNRPLEKELVKSIKILIRDLNIAMTGYAKESNKNTVANADIRESFLFECFNESIETANQLILKSEVTND